MTQDSGPGNGADEPADIAARGGRSGQLRLVTIAWMGLLNVALLAIGAWSTFEHDFPIKDMGIGGLAVALGAIGIVTFLAFYNDSADIRTAIAGSFVIVYFAVLTASLNTGVSDRIAQGGAKLLFDNFTALVGIIVSFYITGKSVEKVGAKILDHKMAELLAKQSPPPGPKTD